MVTKVYMGKAEPIEETVKTLKNDVDELGDQVQGLEAKHPDAPTADGEYTLHCTVSGGIASYSWMNA